MRYTPGWWFAFILSWFSSRTFHESFSRARTFWYCRDSWMELPQMHSLPYHHFSEVHVRYLTHPLELFSSHQGRLDAQLLYWSIFPSFSCGDDCVLTDLSQSPLFDRGMFICVTSHSFDDFCWDEPPEEHNLLGFDYPIIHDFLVDFCVKVAVVTAMDYSLDTPHWITPLRWRWVPPTEFAELEASNLL